ncbi:hypothetical protein MMC25_000117 [Agyrium rufum]|nr:hypothetical protein [Agyrium rufum]
MGRLKGHMIYKVIATEFLPLRERSLDDPDENTYRTLVKNLLISGPMYFSYSYDITNSLQRQAFSDLEQPLWKRADDRFFWNRYIQSDLIDFRKTGLNGSATRRTTSAQPGVDAFILPVMYGMMEISSTRIKSTPFSFTLITRRSRHRAGTRYFSRGINEDGHVSNFNETEQIVVLNDNDSTPTSSSLVGRKTYTEGQEIQALAFVQTRGSVPVFWAEINNLHYTPTLQVRDVETAIEAARKHFSEQIRLYGDNYLVNLVNQKGREDHVKQAYENMVRTLISAPQEGGQGDRYTSEKLHVLEPSGRENAFDRLHYVYFDFHNETKGLKWHRSLLLLEQLKQGLIDGGYFRAVNMPGDTKGNVEVRYQQTAVVRTNCMDCLDRTNVVQTMIARWTLTRQLVDAGILNPGESQDDDANFQVLFRNVWADNADVVSNSYSGTGALKTDFTRTGKRTRVGALQDLNNSITRYVRNNFLDGPRQDAFDVFLGTYSPSSHVGGGRVFKDDRPPYIQAMPYVLATSFFMVLVSLLTRRVPNAAVWPLRSFMLFWVVVGVWAYRFIQTHGMLYVSQSISHALKSVSLTRYR